MSYSYRKQLTVIGERVSKTVSYRSFACVGKSFRQTMEGMNSPEPQKWTKPSEYKNSTFLESCQGVANDGTNWYFTANGNKGRQGIFKYDQSMKQVGNLKFSGNMDLLSVPNIPKMNIPFTEQTLPVIGHVGDPDCYEGKIYIPVQDPHGFLVLDTSLSAASVNWYPTDKIGDSHPWCAVNPWNGRLYTSTFNAEPLNGFDLQPKLFAYDRRTFKRKKSDDITLKVPTQRVQGGCFTNDGKLFLTSDVKNFEGSNTQKFERIKNLGTSLKPSITCYSIVNGHYYGAIGIMRESGVAYSQEVEGITYWAKKEKGKKTNLHVVLLENELGTDEVFFKHYAALN